MAVRKPLSVAEQLERLEGSPAAKERLRVLLLNLAGELSPGEACLDLEVQESWFFDLKHRGLQGLLEALEPGVPGRRPPPPSPEAARIAELEAENARLQRELAAAQVRAELAAAGLSRRPAAQRGAAKKTRR
jgi:hypothetical protein